jgi:hypothetical protein
MLEEVLLLVVFGQELLLVVEVVEVDGGVMFMVCVEVVAPIIMDQLIIGQLDLLR